MDWVNLPWDKVFVVVTVLVSGIGIVAGVIVPAIGQAIEQLPRLSPGKIPPERLIILQIGARVILRLLLDPLPFHGARSLCA